MDADRIGGLEALLAQTEAAHGVYETTQLNGVYDQEWPRWYAGFAVEHGLGDLLGHDVTAEAVAEFLTRAWDELQRADPKPTEPWSTLTARRMAAEL